MSKEQSVRRLPSGRVDNDLLGLGETFTALIQEAHKQRRTRSVSSRSEPTLSAIREPQFAGGSAMLPENLHGLLRETVPHRRLDELVLERTTRDEIKEFLLEAAQTSLLRAHSLEPRHTVLLIGPPGTGKTSLAGVMATELSLPFLTVRYDGLVGSYLGETASRLQDIIDYAARTPCVLFFDEFDSVGKERSDAHETGEIKRVVSSLLLQMDGLPSHCIVVCATNHPELLDRAVWRRFELRIELPRPGAAELREWYMRTEKSFGSLGLSAKEFTTLFQGETYSEIEGIILDARRKVVLSHGRKAVSEAFKEAVVRWKRRREVGGEAFGARSNRKNKPRAGAAGTDSRPKGEVPAGDLLSGTGD